MKQQTPERERIDHNEVILRGVMEENFSFHHTSYGKYFFFTTLRVARLSGTNDFIPLIAPLAVIEKIMTNFRENLWVEVRGSIRTHNVHDYNGHSTLKVFVYVTSIEEIQNEEEKDFINHVLYEGHICKEPRYRKTPLGREITDLMIAVNRTGRSSYIPSITWGPTARIAATLGVGTHVYLNGRFQSREYFKRTSKENPEDGEVRTTYEVSIRKMDVLVE